MHLAVRNRSRRVSPCVRGGRLFIVVESKQVVCPDVWVIRHLAHALNNLSDTGEHRRCVSDAPQLEPLTANVGGFAYLRREESSCADEALQSRPGDASIVALPLRSLGVRLAASGCS